MKEKFQYIQSFDSLRGAGALFVMLLHGSYGFFKGGWIGVDLFFALSGFLISSLLRQEYALAGKISFSKFYARRALRLFPSLIITVLISNALWSFTDLYSGANRLLATTGALFYFTNLLNGNVSGNMAHLWSLSVEEHFYFLWPAVVFILMRKWSYYNHIIFLTILFIFITIFRILIQNFDSFFVSSIFSIDANRFTFFKIDGIILGSLIAFIPYRKNYITRVTKNKSSLIIVILVFIFTTILLTLNEDNLFWRNGGFVLTNILCSLTVLIAIEQPNHYLLSNKILKWLGKRSYGIYVYHFPVFLALEGIREPGNIINLLLVTSLRFIISVGLAALSYKYIEQPILKYKKLY